MFLHVLLPAVLLSVPLSSPLSLSSIVSPVTSSHHLLSFPSLSSLSCSLLLPPSSSLTPGLCPFPLPEDAGELTASTLNKCSSCALQHSQLAPWFTRPNSSPQQHAQLEELRDTLAVAVVIVFFSSRIGSRALNHSRYGTQLARQTMPAGRQGGCEAAREAGRLRGCQ